MTINYVFPGLAVADRDAAAAWYERFFGRPPDIIPNEAEVMWQLNDGASLYVIANPERAGRGTLALAVDSMERHLKDLASRGIEAGPIEEIPGAGRKSVVVDPDGNMLSMLELVAGG
ncbi:MAG: glyoxalase [Acidimicrobiales bacterium]|nr:glyoxalase [Acidimicrobiales bacterium]